MKVAGGTGFAKLWAAQGISVLGDGVYGTAPPLLAATLTREPLLVSLVSFAEWLPWLLFGLLSGALLDRWNRRRVMWTVDAARFAIVAGLAVAVLADQSAAASARPRGRSTPRGGARPCGSRSPRACAGWPPTGCCGRRPPWSPSSTSWPRPAAP
jgi:MFS family permease